MKEKLADLIFVCIREARSIEELAERLVDRGVQIVPEGAMILTRAEVEVVRCRDCKYLAQKMIDEDLEFICKCFAGMVVPAPDLYCSYGERREE